MLLLLDLNRIMDLAVIPLNTKAVPLNIVTLVLHEAVVVIDTALIVIAQIIPLNIVGYSMANKHWLIQLSLMGRVQTSPLRNMLQYLRPSMIQFCSTPTFHLPPKLTWVIQVILIFILPVVLLGPLIQSLRSYDR